MSRKGEGREAPNLSWLDDDDKTVEFRRERPQTWLEELGELNDEGRLDAVSRTLHFPRHEEETSDSDDDAAWL